MTNEVGSVRETWSYRTVMVPGWEVEFRVPRYIIRANDAARTYGWQLRYGGKTKFFSDRKYAHRGDSPANPEAALDAAMTHLETIWVGVPAKQIVKEHKDKQHKFGAPGVRIVWRSRAKSKTKWCVVRVDGFDGHPLKSFYVGTTNTATDERIKIQVEKAVKLRLAYMEKHGVTL